MKLHVLGSSSKGDCYLIADKDKCLIIEAGINPKEVLKAIDFDLKKIVGILVTHEHQDHAKYIGEWLDKGLKVYLSKGTLEMLSIKHHNLVIIEKLKQFYMNDFKILPFDVKHDAEEPLGFLINNKSFGNLLFVTDSYYCKYKFKGLNHIMIEANYDEAILEKSKSEYKNRVLQSHMSIDTCLKFLRSNDLSQVETITLLHLSDGHSNEDDFKRKARSETGKITYIANKGLEINLEDF